MSQIALTSRNGTAPKRQTFLKQTVQDFFGTLNWEGIEESKPAVAAQNIPGSAEDLFADFGADLETGLETELAIPTAERPIEPLNINTATTSVEAFFQAFPWEGQPVIGAPVTPDLAGDILPNIDSEEDDGMTLDAFSDLF